MVDYQALFEAAPGAYLVLDPNLIILAVNNMYLNATLTKRDEIVGKGLFEVFPDNPQDTSSDGVNHLRASLKTVISTLKPHTMAVQKYDIPLPSDMGGGFEERYWSPVNTPVLNQNKQLIYIIHRVEDVSEFVRANKANNEQIRRNEELLDKTTRIEAEIYRNAQTLRTRDREITNIFEYAPIGMATVSLSGHFIDVNQSFCKILAYSKSELLQLRFHEITHPDDLSNDLKNLEALLADKTQTYRIEKRYIRKNGSIVWGQLTVSLLRNELHTPINYIAQIEDITQRKYVIEQLAKTSKQNQDLLSNLPVGVMVHTPQSEMIFCNREAEAILGLTPNTIKDKTLSKSWELVREDKSPMPLDEYPLNKVIRTLQGFREVIIGVAHPDPKQIIWLSVNAFPEFDEHNALIQIVITFVNISAKVNAEETLLNKAKALKRSNDALDEFAYIASHDLKEPLRGISNYSSFLMEDYGDKLDAEGKSQLETLQKLSGRLESLLNNLLIFSRVSRIDMALVKCDLNTVITDKTQLLETYLSENNAIIEVVKKLPVVICDHSRIGQVFQNLITNAIKYNKNKIKQVVIDHSETKNEFIFSVKDNGIGIPQEHYDTIFKIFRRLHGRDEFGGGTGAGLTLAKKIIERHGGNVWLESEKDNGSTFYFSISKNINMPNAS